MHAYIKEDIPQREGKKRERRERGRGREREREGGGGERERELSHLYYQHIGRQSFNV